MNLVIVESPGKINKIQHFLGNGYTVVASNGHVRDLPENGIGIDISAGFKPQYVIPAKQQSKVSSLKKAVANADLVLLASDEDREGEAISWHLKEVLELDPAKTQRIVFHEITQSALQQAIQNPRSIDMALVDAQQARRVLDRLVGFELSPLLWRKVRRGLSAGRVQSVALRLITDKEKEILEFHNEAYYKVEAVFCPEGITPQSKVKAILDTRFSGVDAARDFLSKAAGATYTLENVESKQVTRCPAAPFTTSTLQQEASRKLHLSVGRTMSIAQSLYEKGLITYMRTDSTTLSSLAINTAKAYITKNYGGQYSKVRQYRTKAAGAQEAHEAIRPTYIENTSISGTAEEQALYSLIWKRTVASQMSDASLKETTLTIGTPAHSEKFHATSNTVLFDGFLKLYMEGRDDEEEDDTQDILPDIAIGTRMIRKKMDAQCKFTAAPSRYSEASLVKKLEELGIGRPSTYVPTISTLVKRNYVSIGNKEGEKKTVTNLSLDASGVISESRKVEIVGADKRKLLPQDIGMQVSDYLVDKFPDIVDYGFTANVENDFDEIASGRKVWNSSINDFYAGFHSKVDAVMHDGEYSRKEDRVIGTDPSDGKKITAKFGRNGAYVQKGSDDDPDKKTASLARGQLIDSLSLEDALKLLALPRKLGAAPSGEEITVLRGPYGPYIKCGAANVSIPKGENPLTITLQRCLELVEAHGSKQPSEPIKDFGEIKVLPGRYGAYIKANGSNYKIPSGTDAQSLTLEQCQSIISQSSPTAPRRRGGFRRKTRK